MADEKGNDNTLTNGAINGEQSNGHIEDCEKEGRFIGKIY